ncbi:MAG: glycoside hydrolase family 31 protein [Deltaproteobacteria bacterium]|nr:glycoside hydrolase family 31 protein [Deltaproteobacteria bacterium]
MPITLLRAALPALLLLSLVGCREKVSSRTVTSGELSVELPEEGGLRVMRGDTLLLGSPASADPTLDERNRRGAAFAPFALAETSFLEVEEFYGFHDFDEDVEPFVSLVPTDLLVDGARMLFSFEGGGDGAITIHDDGAIQIHWTVPETRGDRLAMSFDCVPDERYFGLGAQVSAEHRGWRVPIWTTEQGVGKDDRGEPQTLFGVIGRYYDSYAPVPFALSSRPLGIWLEGTDRNFFDLCDDADRLRIESHSPGRDFDLWIAAGETMAESHAVFTARTGRPEPVARWTFAPWADTFGGPTGIADALALLRDRDIPTSAIWAEDWVGTLDALGGEHLAYDWEEDPARYPDLAGTADAVHAAGMRLLVYLNPYVPRDASTRTPLFEAGALARDAQGGVIELAFPFGEPPAYYDMTRAGAREIFHGYLQRAVAKGVDGWMADYGEEFPFEAVAGDGRPGSEAHNAYPSMWARESTDYWRAERPDDDWAIFTRSGHTGVAADTHIHWLGDQLTSFDRNDGFGSVLPLYLSAGLSGIALTHSDVGGYTSVPGKERTFEVWARWLAFEAFTPFLRTHHTSSPAAAVQWWTDDTTLALYGRYARWHQRLMPYFAGVVGEAVAGGVPAVRPVWWGNEGEETLLDIEDQVLCGGDLLLAPIVTEGATERSVSLPPGRWRRWSDFASPLGAAERGTVQATTAIEDASVWVRTGAVIPLLPEDYESLIVPRGEHAQPTADVTLAPASLDHLLLMVVGGGSGQQTLGGYGLPEVSFDWQGEAITSGPFTRVLNGAGDLPACGSPAELDCIEGDLARLGPTSLAGTIDIRAASGNGLLTVSGSGLARLDLQLR